MDEQLDENLSLPEQIKILMEDLPGPVQNFLRSSERDRISLELSKKYRLHADAAGAFERAYLFMLLGVFTPDEFVQDLRESELDDEIVRSLVSDVNELVFKKLRAEEQSQSYTAPVQSEPKRVPPTPAVPVMQVGVVPPTSPTMATTSHGLTGQPISPARSFQTASVPITYAPVQTAPAPQSVAPPAAPMPVFAPAFEPPATPITPAPVRLTPVDRAPSNAPITKEYGSDPYREPIG